jgi:hypothetical protein
MTTRHESMAQMFCPPLRRNVTLIVPTFFSALMAVATSDMVATVQEHESRSAISLCGL